MNDLLRPFVKDRARRFRPRVQDTSRSRLTGVTCCAFCLILTGCAVNMYYGEPSHHDRSLDGWSTALWLQSCPGRDTMPAGLAVFSLNLSAMAVAEPPTHHVGIDSIMVMIPGSASRPDSVLWRDRVVGEPPDARITGFDGEIGIGKPFPKRVIVRVFYAVTDAHGQGRRTSVIEYVLSYTKSFAPGGA